MPARFDPLFPRLRPGLAAAADGDPRFVYLYDQLRITATPLKLTRDEFDWVRLFNGRRSARDVQEEAMRRAGGLLVPIEPIECLIARLDAALFLDNQRFADYLTGPDREPACLGCYEADPTKLRRQLASLFTAPGGPGRPGTPGCRIAAEGRVRAVLVPHIDYARGGVTYGWGFKELVERTDASLFVVIATSHYSPERFTLTRKNFKTPLGKVATDQEYIDRLEKHYGDGLFDDPVAHLPEHSVELEVVLLQYLLGEHRPIRIVPLVVGSFGDCVERGREPKRGEDVRRMIEALRRVEAELREPVCYVISGDLAHVGPKFDDPEPVAEPFLSESLARDQELMRRAEAVDAKGYFHAIAAEQDRRRICGLPPTYVTLEAAGPTRGKLLHYGRYIHPHGHESVSFASVAFDA
jgi:AmmeMemoRadiSam system protein B